jgi:hypothetical protein
VNDLRPRHGAAGGERAPAPRYALLHPRLSLLRTVALLSRRQIIQFSAGGRVIDCARATAGFGVF